jgi:putative aldouronate transport system permease protein
LPRSERGSGAWKRREIGRHLPLYAMMLPGLLYILINNYLPLAGLQIAFKKFNYSLGVFGSHWSGLKNFTFLFRTSDAWIVFRNTLGYNALFIVLGTVFSVAVAILLNEIGKKALKQVYQTAILIPFLISYVVVSYIAFAFLSPAHGLINEGILRPLGFAPIAWYAEPSYWPFILVTVNVWKTFGYSSIIYYATIVGIDRTFYEAAYVDGASTRSQIRYVTLPMLRPAVITLTLLSIGRIFYSDFGLFYQVPMNSGLLYEATNTIDTYVYRGLLELNDIGRSSAAGFLQSILGFVMVFGANEVVKRVEKENALF